MRLPLIGEFFGLRQLRGRKFGGKFRVGHLGVGIALGGGEREPFICLHEIRLHALAERVHHAQGRLALGEALLGGLAEPLERFHFAGPHAFAFGVHHGEVHLRLRVPLFGGLAIPRGGARIIARQIVPFIIHPTDAELERGKLPARPGLLEGLGDLVQRDGFLFGIGNLRGDGERLHKNFFRLLRIPRLRHCGGDLLQRDGFAFAVFHTAHERE